MDIVDSLHQELAELSHPLPSEKSVLGGQSPLNGDAKQQKLQQHECSWRTKEALQGLCKRSLEAHQTLGP